MDTYPSAHLIVGLPRHDASNDDTFASIASSLKGLLATAETVFGSIEHRVRVGRAPGCLVRGAAQGAS